MLALVFFSRTAAFNTAADLHQVLAMGLQTYRSICPINWGTLMMILVWIALPLLGASFCLAWLYWAGNSIELAKLFANASNFTEAGQWGDAFGGFNALFGALGFAAVMSTLLFQAISLNRQQRDLHRQAFESSFFELLDLVRQARNEVRYRYSAGFRTATTTTGTLSGIQTGQAAFRAALIEANYWLNRAYLANPKLSSEDVGSIYRKRIHSRYESTFGVYFRLINTILSRISNDSLLTNDEKVKYGNVLRGQLTSQEAALAGVNALAPFSGNFKKYVVFFRLLKYVRLGSTRNFLRRYYPPSTFLSRPKKIPLLRRLTGRNAAS